MFNSIYGQLPDADEDGYFFATVSIICKKLCASRPRGLLGTLTQAAGCGISCSQIRRPLLVYLRVFPCSLEITGQQAVTQTAAFIRIVHLQIHQGDTLTLINKVRVQLQREV